MEIRFHPESFSHRNEVPQQHLITFDWVRTNHCRKLSCSGYSSELSQNSRFVDGKSTACRIQQWKNVLIAIWTFRAYTKLKWNFLKQNFHIEIFTTACCATFEKVESFVIKYIKCHDWELGKLFDDFILKMFFSKILLKFYLMLTTKIKI